MRIIATNYRFLGTVDMTRSDGYTLQSAARHMNADYRNAVVVEGHVYWRVIAEPDAWNPDDARVKQKAPDGTVTVFKNITEALRQWRKA